jgi:hypothetical protein
MKGPHKGTESIAAPIGIQFWLILPRLNNDKTILVLYVQAHVMAYATWFPGCR